MTGIDAGSFEHERVLMHSDPASGLVGIVAIHNRNRGPAIGGCRVLPYPTVLAALTDVLRLSRGMTYKCAIAGIPYGGGKAVMIADPATEKTEAKLIAMARLVDSLGGAYITSFDSGTTMDDLHVMRSATPYVAGIAQGFGNASQSTATGVFHCMAAAWRARTGRELAGATVAIQGLGNVGYRLARLLEAAGARLVLADAEPARLSGLPGQIVAPEAIHAAPADIFAPCALGAVLNERSIDELKAGVIVGGANNQLATPEDAARLQARDILYCPDYLANAGGIVELHYQRGGGTADELEQHLKSLADTFEEILARAAKSGRTTAEEADLLAEQRFGKAGPQ